MFSALTFAVIIYLYFFGPLAVFATFILIYNAITKNN